MAPHLECPSTTTRRAVNRSIANSTLPTCEGATMLPATRNTNRSPSPWSKMISTGTRESEHPRIVANGSWPPVSSARRRGLMTDSELRFSSTKRRLPARRRCKASRAGIIGSPYKTQLLKKGTAILGVSPASSNPRQVPGKKSPVCSRIGPASNVLPQVNQARGPPMFKYIAIALAVAVAAVLIAAGTRPDTFRVERAIRVSAPPEKIFHYVNDFHQWGVWSPYEKLDPSMKRSFAGTPAGNGAVYEWDGNSKAG